MRPCSLTDSALGGLRVIDLSQGIAGPYCARLLADLGAEVIKVEPPEGDFTRRLGPFPGDVPDPEKSGLFIHLNGNKQSVTVDLDSDEGRAVLRKLIASADVLIESETPGRMAELGLGFGDVSGECPKLVYCSVTPFGQTGPYAKFTGNSLTCMALSGLMYVTGDPDKEPLITGGEPADYFGGLHAWVCVLAALEHRGETGAGQHGVATATACAIFDLECVVYMGEEDVERQALNVYRMELLGAEVRPVGSGTRTLKDATNEAIRDWVTHVETTHYIIGSVVGPDPFPRMVRDFQSVIGCEAREQILEMEGRLPEVVIACVGGGSNAIGIFHAFMDDADVQLVGVEAGGEGIDSGRYSASLAVGSPGVLHGSLSYLLQDSDGQVAPAHSVSAGLDYPGVGPEHSFLKDSGRARYTFVTDDEALGAFHRLSELEGIIPALESAHAVAYVLSEGKRYEGPILLCLSGRGDKDVAHVARIEGRGSLL